MATVLACPYRNAGLSCPDWPQWALGCTEVNAGSHIEAESFSESRLISAVTT